MYRILALLSSVILALISINSVNAASDDTINQVYNYCVLNSDKITTGVNPIQDMIKAGLISQYDPDFMGKTCADISLEHNERIVQSNSRNTISEMIR